MDLGDEFDDVVLHDSQIIMEEYDKAINRVKEKEEEIKTIHTGLDQELNKLDALLISMNSIKQQMNQVQNDIHSHIDAVNGRINTMDKELEKSISLLAIKINDLQLVKDKCTPPPVSIKNLIIIGLGFGFSVGMIIGFVYSTAASKKR